MAALTCPGRPKTVATAIRRATESLRNEEGWFGRLDSSLRFIVATMLLAHGDNARGFLKEVKRMRKMFRSADLRRAGAYETITILILRMNAEKSPISEMTVQRFKAVYEEMKRHHWWLTGPDDFPGDITRCCGFER